MHVCLRACVRTHEAFQTTWIETPCYSEKLASTYEPTQRQKNQAKRTRLTSRDSVWTVPVSNFRKSHMCDHRYDTFYRSTRWPMSSGGPTLISRKKVLYTCTRTYKGRGEYNKNKGHVHRNKQNKVISVEWSSSMRFKARHFLELSTLHLQIWVHTIKAFK
jgi:hypothetical protein